jgi:hypothetical protein
LGYFVSVTLNQPAFQSSLKNHDLLPVFLPVLIVSRRIIYQTVISKSEGCL